LTIPELSNLMDIIFDTQSIAIGYRQTTPLGPSSNAYTGNDPPEEWSWGEDADLTVNETQAIENQICNEGITDYTYLWRSGCASLNQEGFGSYFCGDIGCNCFMTSIYEYAVCVPGNI